MELCIFFTIVDSGISYVVRFIEVVWKPPEPQLTPGDLPWRSIYLQSWEEVGITSSTFVGEGRGPTS